jgi:hypothetical protein
VVSARYIMKCDDDTFVRLDSVMAEVKKIRNGESIYIGNMNYHHKPLRSGKWAVTYEVSSRFLSNLMPSLSSVDAAALNLAHIISFESYYPSWVLRIHVIIIG